jgi:YHS domain-containing protein
MARPVGRLSAACATALSSLVALGFFTAASWTGEAPAAAVAGGTIWVFVLALIVSMPAVTAWAKRRQAGAVIQEEVTRMAARDPVCGMDVDEKKAAAVAAYKGQTYYFCAPACKTTFEKAPEKYVGQAKKG